MSSNKLFSGIENKRSKSIIILSAALLLSMLMLGIARASIPSSDGVITGCYRTSGLLANGQLRIIDADTSSCNSNETELSWLQGASAPASNNILGRVVVEPQSSTELLAQVSGFGDFTVNPESCAEGDIVNMINFTNTSGETLYSDFVGGGIEAEISPLDTIVLEADNRHYTVGKGAGSTFTAMSFTLGTSPIDSEFSQCSATIAGQLLN